MKGIFKKADFILMAVLVTVGILCSVILAASHTAGERVTVTVDGTLYGTYRLSEDKTIIVRSGKDGKNENTVEIKGGSVRVSHASCKNQLCVRHAAVSRTGQSIICLPNRVVVSVVSSGEKGNEYDAISN